MRKNKIEIEFDTFEKYNYWPHLFKEIKQRDEEQSIDFNLTNAKLSTNSKLNRYKNILPYDHSRVKLEQSVSKTDYINANYVECKLAQRKYILCQGPLENTCEHFWQMIWEQNSKAIVMLNRLYENEMLKCEMYYPNNDEINKKSVMEFGIFRLTHLADLKATTEYLIRKIEIENLKLNSKREILHFHYKNWPDFGEPKESTSFLNFLNQTTNEYHIFNSDLYGPPIIHCSAGVGRSGTFILIDSMIQLFKKYDVDLPINACQLLIEFRRFRMGLVQTPHQLKFAYLSIVDYIKKAQSEIKTDCVLDQEETTSKEVEADKSNSELDSSLSKKQARLEDKTNMNECEGDTQEKKRIRLSSSDSIKNEEKTDEREEKNQEDNSKVYSLKRDNISLKNENEEDLKNKVIIDANQIQIELVENDQTNNKSQSNPSIVSSSNSSSALAKICSIN